MREIFVGKNPYTVACSASAADKLIHRHSAFCVCVRWTPWHGMFSVHYFDVFFVKNGYTRSRSSIRSFLAPPFLHFLLPGFSTCQVVVMTGVAVWRCFFRVESIPNVYQFRECENGEKLHDHILCASFTRQTGTMAQCDAERERVYCILERHAHRTASPK